MKTAACRFPSFFSLAGSTKAEKFFVSVFDRLGPAGALRGGGRFGKRGAALNAGKKTRRERGALGVM